MLNAIFCSLGRRDALELRARASQMDGTGLIAEEAKIPAWNPEKDYSSWPVGAPVLDGGQVWVLIQPYDARLHPEHPSEIRAHWGLCHTKDPGKAKPWVDPAGTSGLYRKDECYRAEDRIVWRCKAEQTCFDASAQPETWEPCGTF